jgi:hypothetical protein
MPGIANHAQGAHASRGALTKIYELKAFETTALSRTMLIGGTPAIIQSSTGLTELGCPRDGGR